MDLTKVEQPDELIQLAWNAGLDRKAVLREGVDAARLLLAGELNDLVTLFWPVPRPLEAVDHWSENHPDPRLQEKLRPYASAVVPACVFGGVVTHVFVAPRTSEDHAAIAVMGLIVGSYGVFCLVLKVLLEAVARRQVARLDENSALALVLDQLRLGMRRRPALAPRAAVWIRRGLAPPPSTQH